ncbi:MULTISPECIES: GNAT family N-acetyltransferase [Gordonia]|uniref:GNAT family N-acetyltransferase n=1 Tax=Gordonia TaxID=2053 RepID=UPI00257E7E47|nr:MULTISPECIES: GNAT family N-acetyltransferase [Gordonia]
MSVTIRPLSGPDEVNAAFRVFLRSMVGLRFGQLDAATITEQGRYLGAFDSDVIVAGADSYSSQLVVPGGARVPHAAVTHVGVLPTHRRRGIVTGLIERQLQDIADRGEVVATLRASEAVIYERFGYGIASSSRAVTIDAHRARLRDTVPGGDSNVRLVDDAVTTELLADIYGRAATWVGAIDRPAGWWRLQQLRRDASPVQHYVAVHSSDGVDDGYVVYKPEDPDHWFSSDAKTITVVDFVASGPTAWAALWRHLSTLDLVDVIEQPAVALDDSLPLAVTDPRAVRLGTAHDETWLRLVDVESAFRARTYRIDDPVRLEVVDPLIERNNAVFEIGPKGTERVTGKADATTDVATLAAAYLGGTRWRSLADVGRVDVSAASAVDRLDGLFATGALPFAGTVF